MQAENFIKSLQDNLNSLEQYLKTLLEKNYKMSVVERVKKYGLDKKNGIKKQYNTLSKDIQQKFKTKYNEFVKKSDEIINNAIEKARNNYTILCYYNDVFYNDINLEIQSDQK